MNRDIRKIVATAVAEKDSIRDQVKSAHAAIRKHRLYKTWKDDLEYLAVQTLVHAERGRDIKRRRAADYEHEEPFDVNEPDDQPQSTRPLKHASRTPLPNRLAGAGMTARFRVADRSLMNELVGSRKRMWQCTRVDLQQEAQRAESEAFGKRRRAGYLRSVAQRVPDGKTVKEAGVTEADLHAALASIRDRIGDNGKLTTTV